MSQKSSLRTKFEILLLFLTIISMVFLFVEAQNNFSTIKPMLAKIYPLPAEVKINEVKFNYNPLSQRYDNVSVTISNVGSSSFEGKVVVLIYNATNSVIASGEKVTPAPIQQGNSLSLNISLVWVTKTAVVDYAYAMVSVS